MFEVALSLSIAGLLLGPLLTSWARGHGAALTTLGAAMLGVVLPLLLLRLIPHLIEETGTIAMIAVVSGYAVFIAVESRMHACTRCSARRRDPAAGARDPLVSRWHL